MQSTYEVKTKVQREGKKEREKERKKENIYTVMEQREREGDRIGLA
jgi:hypothetical protein